MTKIKKSLLAVLLGIMAIALGFASVLTFGTAKAASATQINNFVRSIATFDVTGVIADEDGEYDYSNAGLLDTNDQFANYKGTTTTYRQLWMAYATADQNFNNGSLGDLTATEIQSNAGLAEALDKYDGLRGVLGEFYGEAARINSQIVSIKSKGYKEFKYSDSISVNELYAYVGLLKDGDSTADPAVPANPGAYAFIACVTGSNFAALEEAHNYVLAREATIDAIIEAIQDIDNIPPTGTVTIADGPSIKAVTTLIEGKKDATSYADMGLHKEDIAYLISSNCDYVYDDGSEDGLAFKTEYDKYLAAKAAYDKLAKAADNFMADIKALYESLSLKKGEEVYYTKKDSIAKLNELYAKAAGLEATDMMLSDSTKAYGVISNADLVALVSGTNYKDAVAADPDAEPPVEAADAVTYADLLTEMAAQITAIETEIAAVITKIDDVLAFSGTKYTGFYTKVEGEDIAGITIPDDNNGADADRATAEYRDLILIAMNAFEALHNDIKVADVAAFNANTATPAPTELKAYLVTGSGDGAKSYEDLKKAYDEYLAWDTALMNTVKAIKELADKIVNLGGNYDDLLKYKSDASEYVAALNADQDAIYNIIEVTITKGEGDGAESITHTCPDWLAQANTFLDEIGGTVGTLIAKIKAYSYSFATQQQLVELLSSYYSLSKDNQMLVSNRDTLIGKDGYKDMYQADLDKVADWKEAVEAIDLTKTEPATKYEAGKVTAYNLAEIKTAVDLFKAISEDKGAAIAGYYDAFVLEARELTEEEIASVEGKSLTGTDALTATEIEILLQLNYKSYIVTKSGVLNEEGVVVKNGYDQYYDAYDVLNSAISKITEAFEGLYKIKLSVDNIVEITSFANLSVQEAVKWTGSVNTITTVYENDLDTEFNAKGSIASKLGAQDYVKETYATQWDQYQEALGYVKKYNVEAKIAEIWEDYDNSAVTTDDDYAHIDFTAKTVAQKYIDYITLALTTKITAARSEFDGYKGGLEIRDEAYLIAAETKLEEIGKEVKEWSAKVNALAGTMTKENHGLDLTTWLELLDEYASLVDGKWVDDTDPDGANATTTNNGVKVYKWVRSVSGETVTYTKTYLKLEEKAADATIDAEKVEALKADFEKFVGLLTKSDKATNDFDGKLKDILDKYNDVDASDPNPGVDNLEADDYAKVTSYKKTYNEDLSTYQKEMLTNWKEFNALQLEAIEAANQFKLLVEKVHDVAMDNMSEFTPLYLEYVYTMYEMLTPEVKAAVGSGWDKSFDQVKYNYNQALEAGVLTNYTYAIQDLEFAVAGLEAAIEGKADAATINAKIEALEAAKTALEGKATKAESDIAKINETLGTLATKAGLDDLKKELEGKITTEATKALNDAKTYADEKIAAANATLKEELEGKIGDLNKLLDDYKKAETDARTAGDKKAADDLAAKAEELQKAINEAKAALEGSISTVSKALEATDTKVAKAETDIKALQDKTNALEAADKDMLAKIDKLNSSVTGLTVGIVIVAIVTAAALAGVIVIFLKKKQ